MSTICLTAQEDEDAKAHPPPPPFRALVEPEKMTVPDPNFRGHRPTLPKLGLGSDTRDDRRASVHRWSVPSLSVHLIGYGSSTSTSSTCSG